MFREMGQEPARRSCSGLEGIIDESELIAKEFEKNSALDAALVQAGQKTEHYEIAAYGTLCSWAQELGNTRIASLLEQNLQEEKEADELLTRVGESLRNPEAARHDTEKRGKVASRPLSKGLCQASPGTLHTGVSSNLASHTVLIQHHRRNTCSRSRLKATFKPV